jgi:hypothetical protein
VALEVLGLPPAVLAPLVATEALSVLESSGVLEVPAELKAAEVLDVLGLLTGADAFSVPAALTALAVPAVNTLLAALTVVAELVVAELAVRIVVPAARTVTRTTAGDRRMLLPGPGVPHQQTASSTRP